MSFPFVPRRVHQRAQGASRRPPVKVSRDPGPSGGAPRNAEPSGSGSTRQATAAEASSSKERKRLQEISAAVHLELSDYGLSKPQNNLLREAVNGAGDDYVHILRLLDVLAIAEVCSSQADIIRALKGFPIQNITLSPNGFGFRRKNAFKSDMRRGTEYWLRRTIYAENFPSWVHSAASVASFLLAISPDQSVQAVFFPRLASSATAAESQGPCQRPLQAQSEAFATARRSFNGKGKEKEHGLELEEELGGGEFRGFAFIVLGDENDVRTMEERWPWDLSSSEGRVSGRKLSPVGESDQTDDASKLDAGEHTAGGNGFRVLSKPAWDHLRDEYLALQKRLQESNHAARQAEALTVSRDLKPSVPPARHETLVANMPRTNPSNSASPLSATAEYPVGVILLGRHILAGASKTTLTSLFDKSVPGAVDYIDRHDRSADCYVRARTASHATSLIAYFSSNPTYLPSSDASYATTADAALEGDRAPIQMELLSGEREREYWMSLPASVRKAARAKAAARAATGVREGSEGRGGRVQGEPVRRDRHKDAEIAGIDRPPTGSGDVDGSVREEHDGGLDVTKGLSKRRKTESKKKGKHMRFD